MIRVEGLRFGYGAVSVLDGLDLEVREGEILGILGPNGCGKSTLLRLLRGLLRPGAGSVRWSGREAHRISRRDMGCRVAVVPQAAPPPFAYRVREVVAMGGYARGRRARVERALALTDILHLADRPVTALSGGELLRKLHGAGCRLTAGPLNRGDSDEVLAQALAAAVVVEAPFSPICRRALREAQALACGAQVLALSPTAWGPGNLPCLELLRQAVARRTRVYLVDPRPERDFTGGLASAALRELVERGARTAADAQEVVDDLLAAPPPPEVS